ncbi:peptide-methionine (R)-S-oxide reductase MsrB [Motilimonas cestriensis]|uniref:peptide-methionine (R)-S-oxide reductase n=1 Tax=Motilimonas cestriensis TaxID=2742685 RepID=A0ABS8WGJ3_9GAMM|nr:peptide-methionine (R)-S-oxide reductase MsrB [Motilimonas cestriensis]MCE2596719.1 peptide-methionine (R)-S-oxide reductase MsrB [Motilimonas cestriensis]
MSKSAEFWRDKLTPEQYKICFEKGTEAPFSGQLLHNRDTGSYHCVCCGQALFASENKFDSGCGWPSFDLALADAIRYLEDQSHGMTRVEVQCSKCHAHLGHVFDDGPTLTHKRYCINSVSMSFNGTANKDKA